MFGDHNVHVSLVLKSISVLLISMQCVTIALYSFFLFILHMCEQWREFS